MAVFCEHCRQQRGWPKPSIRTSDDPCDFCGGFDAYRKRKVVNGEPKIKLVQMKNFSHDNRMLPGMPEETAIQQPITEE